MEHREVEEGNILELYIRLELTPDAEAAFEEHLLVCPVCRRDLGLARAAAEAIELSEVGSFRKTVIEKNSPTERFRLPLRRTLQIAATVLIVTGLASLFIFLIKKGQNVSEPPSLISTLPESPGMKPDTIPVPGATSEKTEGEKGKKDIENRTAGNFIPDSFFENIISESVRHPALTVLSPLKDTLYNMPEFRWKERATEKLILVIFSNREKELFRKEISNGTIPAFRPAPGLYYWQLQDEEETLATGKICFRPPADQ